MIHTTPYFSAQQKIVPMPYLKDVDIVIHTENVAQPDRNFNSSLTQYFITLFRSVTSTCC